MADDGMVGASKPLFPAQLRMCYVAVEILADADAQLKQLLSTRV
jgi:hypothetical protein